MFKIINTETGLPVQDERLVADPDTGLLHYESTDLVFPDRPLVVGSSIWDIDETGQARLRLGGIGFQFTLVSVE